MSIYCGFVLESHISKHTTHKIHALQIQLVNVNEICNYNKLVTWHF
jgi:hypothetical protein